MSKPDSASYCAKCKKRKTCSEPCYPVEYLLRTITDTNEHPPAWYLATIRNSTDPGAYVPPDWKAKSLRRKVFELVYLDGMTYRDAACLAECSHQRVAAIVKEILSNIDKL